jgi:hypothetical protein
MAAKNFRSAFNGFNRQDVVHYIELLNNQHKAQIEQLAAQGIFLHYDSIKDVFNI